MASCGPSPGDFHYAASLPQVRLGTPGALASRTLLPVSSRRSAGILLYRRREGRVEVLLAHPGGPLFGHKDPGSWSLPKGEPSPEEIDFELTARREFEEETGHRVPAGPLIALGTVKQKGGKTVYAWAAEGDLDPAKATSNTFTFEWPPLSGLIKTYPEIDRVEWFSPDEARRHIKEAQLPFLERLDAALASSVDPGESGRPGALEQVDLTA